MDSEHETRSSVILKLMGIDKGPSHYSQHHPIRNRQKVLSEDYLQRVASIGLRKKCLSHRNRSYGTSTDKNEESEDVLKVVKTIRRDKNHNPSMANRKENFSLLGLKEEVMQQKTNNGSQIRLSKSQSDRKDLNCYLRIVFSKANLGKERNGKIKRNIGCKAGFGYSFDRKVPMANPLADNCRSMTKDDLFQKYWGLSKNASEYRSNQKSENRCFENDLSEMQPMISQLSSTDNQILRQTCSMNEDVKNNEDSNMYKKIATSLDSSIDFLVSDTETKVIGCTNNNPTTQKSESTASVMTLRDSDSLCHASSASKQQEISEFQDSVYSLSTEADADSHCNFDKAYKASPISVLDSTFSEDISVISECGSLGVYDSSEVDDEELNLNVSSDEECEKESCMDYEEKKDIVRLSTSEESRDFSYVVEVLTDATISNASLFKDFSTWHSAEYPISPSVFETLEKKFGEQQLWKRSERRLLFDRINLGLLEILHPCLYVPTWEKPVSRRMNIELRQDMIEDEMWGFLVSQEKKAGKESVNDMLGGGEN